MPGRMWGALAQGRTDCRVILVFTRNGLDFGGGFRIDAIVRFGHRPVTEEGTRTDNGNHISRAGNHG